MKFLDNMRAKKIAKEVGEQYEKSVTQWHDRLHNLRQTLVQGIHEDVKVTVEDMMPEGIFFYDVRGSIILDGQGVSTVDATVVDNGYMYSTNYGPAYMLLKNDPRSKEEPSPRNTTMYKVCYVEKTFSQDKEPHFTVERLVRNENDATNEVFPYIFQRASIPTINGRLGGIEQTHFPDVRYDSSMDANFYSGSMAAVRQYIDRIMKPVNKFSQSPRNTIDMSLGRQK